MKVALHTKVRADRIAAYEAAHREVPAELTAAIRGAGVREWTICRSGVDLFHLLDVDDYSAEGAGAPLPAVWDL
ncbi:L-rhamnose mutarotase [Actinacidiphila glaucinigra]|uniref:L-rhamnose mutarotase n=1 Tax=Actinacidiphila glaucinigra TaxID=235986 RepID=UPI003D92A59F